MVDNGVEISVKGKWVRVPGLSASGVTVVIRERLPKTAVVHDEQFLETELRDPELCVRELKAQRSPELRADIFTFCQKLPDTVPRYKYPMEWDSVAVVRSDNFEDWWKKLPQEARKNVRRSQKRGVVVCVKQFGEALISEIGHVNDDSPLMQGKPNAHYGKSADQLRRDYSSFLDRCDFIVAYLGNEAIGFLKLVYRGQVASILNLTTKPSHYDKRPGNALIAKAVELCAARGISYVTYGMFNYGNKRDSPLREFKIRNGFEEMLIPRYYVPLTTWGKLCILLKLHRGLLGILPQNVIMMFVNLRAKWYDLKKRMSRCSLMSERSNCNRQMGRSNPPAGSNV